ncbi:MAG: hypothetical protein AAGG68_30460 [Bacteroidota bacterium]
MMTPNDFFQHIRTLIAQDELDTALTQLQAYLSNSPKLDEVIQQSGRFANIRKQIRLGVVTPADATLSINQIRASILELLSTIEPTTQATDMKAEAEAEQAVSILESKNVVSQSNIKAAGNVQIGDNNTTQNATNIYNIERIDRADFS